jgi:hypothetical protein
MHNTMRSTAVPVLYAFEPRGEEVISSVTFKIDDRGI